MQQQTDTLSTLDVDAFALPDYAAVRLDDGRVFAAPHHELAWRAAGLEPPTEFDPHEGFVLADGRFVDREEGMRLLRRMAERCKSERARSAAQVAERRGLACSEDVRHAH